MSTARERVLARLASGWQVVSSGTETTPCGAMLNLTVPSSGYAFVRVTALDKADENGQHVMRYVVEGYRLP